jgi:hypothetical protein
MSKACPLGCRSLVHGGPQAGGGRLEADASLMLVCCVCCPSDTRRGRLTAPGVVQREAAMVEVLAARCPRHESDIPAGVARSLVLSHTLNFSCRSASRYAAGTQIAMGGCSSSGRGGSPPRLDEQVLATQQFQHCDAAAGNGSLRIARGAWQAAVTMQRAQAGRNQGMSGLAHGLESAAWGKGRKSPGARTANDIACARFIVALSVCCERRVGTCSLNLGLLSTRPITSHRQTRIQPADFSLSVFGYNLLQSLLPHSFFTEKDSLAPTDC